MSTSTNGILFYGIPIHQLVEDGSLDIYSFHLANGEIGDYYDVSCEWEELKGPTKPTNDNYENPEWGAWREAKEKFRKSTWNVAIDAHCHSECPMHYVHGRQYTAYRGNVNEINPVDLIPTPDDDVAIKEFCEKYKIPYKQPKWYLVSYWG